MAVLTKRFSTHPEGARRWSHQVKRRDGNRIHKSDYTMPPNLQLSLVATLFLWDVSSITRLEGPFAPITALRASLEVAREWSVYLKKQVAASLFASYFLLSTPRQPKGFRERCEKRPSAISRTKEAIAGLDSREIAGKQMRS